MENQEDALMLEEIMRDKLGNKSVAAKLKTQLQPYKELMSYYRCAMMEVETKFRVLSEALYRVKLSPQKSSLWIKAIRLER